MPELSLTTITIVAWSKVLLVATFLILLYMLHKKAKAWQVALIASVSVSLFYVIIAKPLQNMWWGGNGDEMFIVAFLSQVLSGSPLNDFYYHGLPQFYPPLYFWITGLLAKPFTTSAIAASKLGVTATMFFWFIGTYLWIAFYNRFVEPIKNKVIQAKWFWFVMPFVLFALIDFNDIILKPYETLPALLLVIFIGLFASALNNDKWTSRHYLFFGISGGLLFLTYYFWWFMAIPALFLLALLSANKSKNLLRVVGIGAVMFIVASPYLIPLFLSYLGGIENWQALYFVPQDFSTFLPFAVLSWKTLLIIPGIIGLIAFYKSDFVKANLILLLIGFGYQFNSIVLFLTGKAPLQAAKPFLFLGTASIAVGSAYLLIWLWQTYSVRLNPSQQKIALILCMIFTLPFWPMASFIDDPVVRNQIEIDLDAPPAFDFAEQLQNAVPDFQDRTWLSTGMPAINAYLPLHYHIAHNPHFSHHAAKYSERQDIVFQLSQTESSSDFSQIVNSTAIDALLLYNNKTLDSYPMFFWQDNYPNGGKELQIDLSKQFVTDLGWNKVYDDNEWVIFIK